MRKTYWKITNFHNFQGVWPQTLSDNADSFLKLVFYAKIEQAQEVYMYIRFSKLPFIYIENTLFELEKSILFFHS